MKKVILFALILTVSGVLMNSVLAQEKERYLVTHVTSSTSGTRSATVVTVVNQSSVSCDVQVEWFQAGSTFSRLVCTGKGTVVPGGQLQFCSRNLQAGVSGGAVMTSVIQNKPVFLQAKPLCLRASGLSVAF
jgi:hypothetical protein